jgi:adenylylsulfate kinase-like enzyme
MSTDVHVEHWNHSLAATTGKTGECGKAGEVIIWINGAFGAGKTTLAEELGRRLPNAMPYDPEYVGYILRKWVPPAESGDFQDIPAWRKLVASFATTLAAEYGRPLIVPMTLVDPDYRDEIFGLITKAGERVLHVFLDVPAAELRRRIDTQILDADDPEADASARRFRHGNVDRCVAARADLPAETLVLRADQHSPGELAQLVLKVLDAQAVTAAREG